MAYNKHFLPLESNPALFSQLIHELGVSPALSFHDVWSLDDPDLLSFIPRPVLAFIIVFPTTSDYEERLATEKASTEIRSSEPGRGDAIWFKQTINNACGLYGILHAVANGQARDFIAPGSHLADLLERCDSLNTADIAKTLEADKDLESKYNMVATQGDTEPPENAEDEVDFHYVCFVKSHLNDNLFILDGDRDGPIDKGSFTGQDLFSNQGIEAIQDFIRHHDSDGENGGQFSLLALAPSSETAD
ncbi:ubiquitin carboxyl-terminal hydrolase, family 1 [Xylariaceae sp. FL1019]|nr:ubiquitin carboxyl-terminal hydrolase, family 1 [Xylariaceae sp. FL1019]